MYTMLTEEQTALDYLKQFLGDTIDILEGVRQNGVKRELSFVIDCSNLEDFNNNDIRDSPIFKDIFCELRKSNGPTIYWIEIVSETDRSSIIDALKLYKTGYNPKATPALKTTINYKSSILYVGKVKGTFWGRLIQHLGFFKVNATQGLQLYHWTQNLNLILKVNILEFNSDMADILPLIEYTFAKRLQPLVGKHK